MKSVLVIVLTVFVSSTGFAGGAVGNGGGFAFCENQRYYFYDYLLTLNNNGRRNISPANLNQSIQYIFFHLKRLNDPLLNEFVSFFSIIYTQTPGKKFQWFQQKNFPLMWEPEIESHLPRTCKKRKQAVYFFAPFAGVPYASYKYDPELLSLVQQQPSGILQISYLWVHEWLWNYFSRDEFMQLAAFNRLLHSEQLSTLNSVEYFKIRPQALVKKNNRLSLPSIS